MSFPFRSTVSRLATPAVLVVLDQGIVSGMRLFIQVAIARWAIDEGMGIGLYVTVFGFIVLAVMVLESFVTTPINVFLPGQEREYRQEFLGAGLRLTLKLAFFFSGLSLLIAGLSRFAGWNMGQTIAVILAWYLPMHLLREFARRWLLAVDRPSKLLMMDLTTSVVLGLVVLALASHLDAGIALQVTNLCNLLFVAMWWYQSRKEIPFVLGTENRFREAAKGYGRWVVAEGIFSVLLVYFSQWQITQKLGGWAADQYGACLTIVFLANPFLLGVLSYFSPRAAQLYTGQGAQSLQAFTWKAAGIVLLALSFLALVFWGWGDPLMSLAFGERFHGLGPTTSILSLGMIMLGISYVFAAAIQAAQAPQLNFLASAVSGSLVVVLSSSLLKNELISAAWIFLVAASAGAFLRIGFLLRRLRLNP